MMQIGKMTGYRSVSRANKTLGKLSQKLSSMCQLNSAADGAAELTVSEKMKLECTSMRVAEKNAKDGVSLVQTAEGAMDEIHDMLQRLVELSDQSANGTYEDGDRASLQKEVEHLKGEIDRIAASTNFNGIPLLDGSLSSSAFRDIDMDKVMALLQQTTGQLASGETAASWTGATGLSNGSNDVDGIYVEVNGVKFQFDAGITDGTVKDNGDIVLVPLPVSRQLLQDAINNSTALQDKMGWNVECTITGNPLEMKLNQPQGSAIQDGFQFEVKVGDSRPPLNVQSESYTPASGMPTIELNGIPITALRNGTELTLHINPTVTYTVQIESNAASCNPTVDNQAGVIHLCRNDSVPNPYDIMTGSGNGSLLQAVCSILENPGSSPIMMAVPDSTNPDAFGMFIKGAPSSGITFPTISIKNPVPVIGPSQSQPASIARPEQPASVTCDINFGSLIDGDSIAFQGVRFEFDTDGAVTSPNIPVSLNDIDQPVEIAGRLAAAFQSAGITGYTMTTDPTNPPDQGRVTVTADTVQEGETLTLEGALTETLDSSLILQIGDGEVGQIRVTVEAMTTASLNLTDVSVSTQEDASNAIDVIRNAIYKVSDNRGTLGATQNRLEHAINNVGNARVNLTDAENQISGTDVAKEMMNFTKEKIIRDAAQSMMAHSMELSRQRVLQLLSPAGE